MLCTLNTRTHKQSSVHVVIRALFLFRFHPSFYRHNPTCVALCRVFCTHRHTIAADYPQPVVEVSEPFSIRFLSLFAPFSTSSQRFSHLLYLEILYPSYPFLPFVTLFYPPFANLLTFSRHFRCKCSSPRTSRRISAFFWVPFHKIRRPLRYITWCNIKRHDHHRTQGQPRYTRQITLVTLAVLTNVSGEPTQMSREAQGAPSLTHAQMETGMGTGGGDGDSEGEEEAPDKVYDCKEIDGLLVDMGTLTHTHTLTHSCSRCGTTSHTLPL
jgi:hypothetical protein